MLMPQQIVHPASSMHRECECAGVDYCCRVDGDEKVFNIEPSILFNVQHQHLHLAKCAGVDLVAMWLDGDKKACNTCMLSVAAHIFNVSKNLHALTSWPCGWMETRRSSLLYSIPLLHSMTSTHLAKFLGFDLVAM